MTEAAVWIEGERCPLCLTAVCFQIPVVTATVIVWVYNIVIII